MHSARLSLADWTITAIRAGTYSPDGGCMFGVIPKERWARVFPPNDANRIPLSLNCYVAESERHTVVIDTGGGSHHDENCAHPSGLDAPLSVVELLQQAGIDPLRVDVVVNSHLHWDHCGGNLTSRAVGSEPAFPNAQYYCSNGEWQHAQEINPRDAVSYDPRNFHSLVRSGRMRLIAEDEYEVAPGIKMLRASGHTRDMRIITVSGSVGAFCFLSDLVPTNAHLLPGWGAAFDLFPLETLSSKLKWLSKAAAGHWMVGFAHDPKVAFGLINKQFALVDEVAFAGNHQTRLYNSAGCL